MEATRRHQPAASTSATTNATVGATPLTALTDNNNYNDRSKPQTRPTIELREMINVILCCGLLFLWTRAIHLFAGVTEPSFTCSFLGFLCHGMGMSTFYRYHNSHSHSHSHSHGHGYYSSSTTATATTRTQSATNSSAVCSSLRSPKKIVLPKVIYHTLSLNSAAKEDENCFSSCPICLVNWSKDDEVSSCRSCQNLFHSACIHEWAARSSSCPCCRQNLVPSDTNTPHFANDQQLANDQQQAVM